MLGITQETSSKLRNISVVCAFLVVIIHCRPHFERMTVGWWMKQLLENGIAEAAVPFFFVVSGFFIAERLSAKPEVLRQTYREELRKRMKSLVVPFIVWNCLYWLCTLGVTNIGWLLGRRPAVLWFPNWVQSGLWYSHCPLLSPLWYVRALVELAILSPLLLLFIQRFRIWGLVMLFLLYGALCPYAPMTPWTWVQDVTRCGLVPVLGFFYFSLGMAISLGFIRELSCPPPFGVALSSAWYCLFFVHFSRATQLRRILECSVFPVCSTFCGGGCQHIRGQSGWLVMRSVSFLFISLYCWF